MTNLHLAFLLGFVGSVHCAVMCGPLMLGLPLKERKYIWQTLQLLLYQLGRIFSYGLLGMLAGLLGSSIKLFVNQETFGFLIGGLLIIVTILHFTGKYNKSLHQFQLKMISPIGKLMGKVYQLPFWGFFAGLLNGLIPCGMVYLALATALNSENLIQSINFMLIFGLGTTPLMMVISLGGIFIKRYVKVSPNVVMPWLTLLIGVLFILRSADLGIPFFSPNSHIHQKAGVECR